MKELEQHKLSAAFPGMTKAELDALTDDIAEEGQREPITIFQGMILDGFHRYQACRACGRVPITVELPANVDPVAFVKSRNLHRRHLSASQRAAAVVACTEWAKSGYNQHTGGGEPGAGATVKEMAKEAEVSTRTIQHAKAAQSAGKGEAVRNGEMSAKEAAKQNSSKVVGNNSGHVTVLPGAESPARDEISQLDGMVCVSEGELNELKANLAEVVAENEAMGKVFDADDRLKAATEEIGRLKAENDGLKIRINGLMTEKNEAVRLVRHLKSQLQKAGQAAAPVTIEAEGATVDGSGLPE